MLLTEWAKDLLQNGIELFQETIEIVKPTGVKVIRDVKLLREVSLGAVSSNNAEEFYRVCRLNAPVGTIITDYEPIFWESLYDDTVTLCRISLTKALVSERNCKSAKTLLDILQRRDSSHWSEQKNIEVKGDNDKQNISISIVGV